MGNHHFGENLNIEQVPTNQKLENIELPFGLRLRRKFVFWLIATLARILVRFENKGLEHIPNEGGLLLATNHMSRVDTGILLLNSVRADIAAIVTDKYKTYPIISFMVNAMPHIWIDRSKADFTAFSSAVKYLKKDGGVLGIAPEGTRSKNGALIEGKHGAAMIAMRAGVPIVPVGITGTENFQSMVRRFRRQKVVANYGPVFNLPVMGKEEDRTSYMERCTEEVMCRIAAQLPEKYHGFYTGHPRIQEILKEHKVE